ncbi:hypothetical protein BT63DRAFT_461058 [Microthyrium microscopicum]|uniref:Uncharacterized protein n=1 Tax=Microthyrium microscopicum TaxID=703497 RepID=A0A6A6TX75_9PEZI|nr:hypothetical protein BT63DRAFT_461058 [Microthyrium microscopicum]
MVNFTFAAVLALSATVLADKFHFQVKPTSGAAVFLKADGSAVSSAAEAATCTIDAGYLSCDGKGGPTFTGDMTEMKLVAGKGSKGWTETGGKIGWNGKNFSIRKGTSKIWAESCPHGHFPDHGTATAVPA